MLRFAVAESVFPTVFEDVYALLEVVKPTTPFVLLRIVAVTRMELYAARSIRLLEVWKVQGVSTVRVKVDDVAKMLNVAILRLFVVE